MRVLLVSTYELGHQPLHLAAAAAEAEAAGHDVRTADVSIGPLADEDVHWADRLAIAVPMHTARRLGGDVAERARALDPDLPIAFFGLYATVAADDARHRGVGAFFAGEYEDGLTDWMADPREGEHVATHRHRHRIPVRASLPPLTEYARLRIGSEERTAGYAEASRGCRHRCRHCPVPTVYDGRYRIVAPEVVVADVASQVAAGARHITFGDPDFWNGPAHAMRVIETVHDEHPEVTFDVTIKVEHLLRHRELLGRLADAGVVFVVSAFEHTDDEVLRLLDKGHTRADMAEAARLVRDADMGLRPTWLPFTPWTTRTHLADIVRFIDEQGLWAETDPIQLTIRLLLPDGSLLTGHEAMAPYLSGADDGALGAAWAHPDPAMDRLAAEVAALAGGGGCDRDRLVAIVDAIGRVTGEPMPTVPDVSTGIGLTESWFCCAEPSADQLATLRS